MPLDPTPPTAAPSRGLYWNTGNGPSLVPLDIGHRHYFGLTDPDTAFWALVRKSKLPEIIAGGPLLRQYQCKRAAFLAEMQTLRFNQQPLAVYFNPTERCNLNCSYCYIPADLRRDGVHMPPPRLLKALEILKKYFQKTLPAGRRPQIIFHGSEPLLAREAMFAGIERHRDYFDFGVQTNGTLLDDSALEFLTSRQIGLGLSLDGHRPEIAGRTRMTWAGEGVFDKVTRVIKALKGYPNYNVICTLTQRNMNALVPLVDFLHALEVPVCMLNAVRCTQPGARAAKPADHKLAHRYLEALDRTYTLYQRTGRKLIVANFANILISILAPAARRLMCDLSPCGGGRCFFALGANGGLFPCSEFIGLPEFEGGNLFKGQLESALTSPAFRQVTGRSIEKIEPCGRCAIRHFCGSPCPAEAHAWRGGLDRPGGFCEFYEEQTRYALRLIADEKADAFLWEGWDKNTATSFDAGALGENGRQKTSKRNGKPGGKSKQKQ